MIFYSWVFLTSIQLEQIQNVKMYKYIFLKQPKIEALKACPTFVELNDLK